MPELNAALFAKTVPPVKVRLESGDAENPPVNVAPLLTNICPVPVNLVPSLKKTFPLLKITDFPLSASIVPPLLMKEIPLSFPPSKVRLSVPVLTRPVLVLITVPPQPGS